PPPEHVLQRRQETHMNAEANDDEVVVAVGWYKPSQWERLEEIASDIKEIWESYEQWHAAMTRRISRRPGEPRRYVKVEIEVEELLAWCQQRDRPVDAAARAEFAAEKLVEQHGG
ncbi:MAG: hypothetical protein WBF17_10745, partial [Phycisphaerae bacterium]